VHFLLCKHSRDIRILILCTAPTCFSTFYPSTIVPTLLKITNFLCTCVYVVLLRWINVIRGTWFTLVFHHFVVKVVVSGATCTNESDVVRQVGEWPLIGDLWPHSLPLRQWSHLMLYWPQYGSSYHHFMDMLNKMLKSFYGNNSTTQHVTVFSHCI